MTSTALEYLLSLKDAIPMSQERPCTYVSNSELRRWIKQGAVLINTERIELNEPINFPVFSLVFFPKSNKRRTTLV